MAEGFGSSFGPLFLAAQQQQYQRVAPHLATADRVALAGALKSWRNTGQWLPDQHGLTADVPAPTVANPQTTCRTDRPI